MSILALLIIHYTTTVFLDMEIGSVYSKSGYMDY